MNSSLVFTLESMKSLSIQLLALLGSGKKSDKLITEIILLVQKTTNIESIGLRLADGIDFPYYFTKGFDQSFIEKENNLCAYDELNELIKDSSGNPILECMCGNVISDRIDSSLAFFTEGGSFWSNCTTDLLALTGEQERQSKTRNCCNASGYESVALIPIKYDGKCSGLLQLNDHRKGMFTLDQIKFLEGVAVNIALLFLMHQKMEELVSHATDVTRVALVKGELLTRLAKELRSKAIETMTNERENTILSKIDSLLSECETLKGIVPICCNCKKVRIDNNYWQQVEEYVKNRSNADFSHTFCPECYQTWINKNE